MLMYSTPILEPRVRSSCKITPQPPAQFHHSLSQTLNRSIFISVYGVNLLFRKTFLSGISFGFIPAASEVVTQAGICIFWYHASYAIVWTDRRTIPPGMRRKCPVYNEKNKIFTKRQANCASVENASSDARKIMIFKYVASPPRGSCFRRVRSWVSPDCGLMPYL